jgi:hypothetical protein
MRVWLRWILGLATGLAVVGIPFAYHRASYVHAKRLRVVTEGKVYRCGMLPAEGFHEAFERHGIRTVVNLQEEDHFRDPLLPATWLESWRGRKTIRESDLCREYGVKYVMLDGGVLDEPGQDPGSRPEVIDEFLEILDDPNSYPILIHCKAGLHRTGLMTAIYRMDKERRSTAEAIRELRANGFGTFGATDSNEYIRRYFVDFEPGVRRKRTR